MEEAGGQKAERKDKARGLRRRHMTGVPSGLEAP